MLEIHSAFVFPPTSTNTSVPECYCRVELLNRFILLFIFSVKLIKASSPLLLKKGKRESLYLYQNLAVFLFREIEMLR